MPGHPGGDPTAAVAQDGAVPGPSPPLDNPLRGIGQECHTCGGQGQGVCLCQDRSMLFEGAATCNNSYLHTGREIHK